MQVILDSSFARPGSTPMGGGKKGEFRDWTMSRVALVKKSCGKCWKTSPATSNCLVSTRQTKEYTPITGAKRMNSTPLGLGGMLTQINPI